ncbi:MAG: EAL domain-containing protein [Planctomycetota bacterium]|nr:EAL domain-containing protein [Planctomycetota bacterium]MDE1889247.1 EAL domain-containing protein [Planctomycetota bacterium]MDE2216808.1 EAL domain-containing protein [Planctomycetota bacterium]
MKILLVDDSAENRDVLRVMSERRGHTVLEAEDGQDGLEKAKVHHPDLIITDALMPKMDGFQFLRNLKKDENLRSIPCAVFSAIYTDSRDRELALSLGAEAFIAKPKRLDELWEEIDAALKRKKTDEGKTKEQLIANGETFIKNYGRVLSAKLEKKIGELERAITERKQGEEELRKLSGAIEQSINIIFITDINGNIEYVNPMFEKITGYSREEAIGQNPRMLASGETPREGYEELWNTLLAGKTWRGLVKNKKKNGQYYWCNCLNYPIINSEGQITHLLAVQEDVTEKMQAEERAKRLTSFDALTGLLNRTRFIEVLNEWTYPARTYNYIGALLLLDIDKFRLINDTYGHMIGDSLLKRMAGILKDILSDIDMQFFKTSGKEKEIGESFLGRMGGDEYVIFLPSRNEDEAIATAEEIRKRIESIWFEDISGRVTLCIGVTIYPKHGIVVRDLFSKADAAVYHAKEFGQNITRLYQTKDLILEKMHSRIKGKERIQKALEGDRFAPWFQPILDLRDDTVHHYEALARIRDVDGGIILPSAFIDTAETFGLITAIDRAIIEKTLKFQSELNKQGTFFSFSMNLSGKEIEDKELLEFLRYKTTEIGVDPKRLIFEITETAAIRELNNAVEFIHNLRLIGCRFSLDDFGVGFTSFKYLKEMEVDYIKIDGSFIRNLPENQSDRLFVKAMTDVAKGMGIKTIAEFVENKKTVDILKEYGVDYAQGYYIGKPSLDI